MARYSQRDSSYSSSSRASPPPAYTPYANNEQAPLLKRREAQSGSSNDPHLGLQLLTLVMQLIILLLFGALLYKILLLILSTITPHATIPAPTPTYSIAIIGAGPAGISAAQYLHSKAKGLDARFNITIFESAPRIGGQLALNDSTGGPVFPYDDRKQDPIIAEDITGTALMWGNPFFTKTSEDILGAKVEFSELPSQQVGYFDGEHIITQTTRPYSQTPTGSWLWHIFKYGASVWRAGAMSREGDLRERFAEPHLVSDIAQLATSLDLAGLTQDYARDGLVGRGIGDPYVTEILAPQVARALSQQVRDVSTLAMALAAFQEDTASAYAGGELLDRLELILGSMDVMVKTTTEVIGLKHQAINAEESAWLVAYDAAFGSQAEAFDRVIVAAPSFDLYRAASVDVDVNDVEAAAVLAYRPAHVAFFTTPSRLNPDVYENVDQVLFLEKQEGGGIRELAFVREVVQIADDGNNKVEYLYRVLSDGDVAEKLQQLNLEVTWLHQAKLDNAYPLLYPSQRFPPFKLSEKGLWWTPAVHLIASTVDMSWLAGQIVAEEVVKDVM